MVLRILFGAVFGALAGYLLGWLIGLFPGFNAAVLEGLRYIAGVDGIGMAALLAGIGFLGGIALGLIASVLHDIRHHQRRDWRWHWRRDWM